MASAQMPIAAAVAVQIVGTCETLEKRYTRLIGPPDASVVRPEPVLRAALAHVFARHRAGASYAYACDQLKSIRQDISVQNLARADRALGFAVEVYERHARLALENSDASEFNQCQTQLEILHKRSLAVAAADGAGAGATQARDEDDGDEEGGEGASLASRVAEFASYRVLYSLYVAGKKGDAPGETATQVARLSSAERAHPWVQHAVRVVAAHASENFPRVFALYRAAPNLSSCLMDWTLSQARSRVTQALARAVRPALPIGAFLAPQLEFAAPAECEAFLRGCGAAIVEPEGVAGRAMDCAASDVKVVYDSPDKVMHERLSRAGLAVNSVGDVDEGAAARKGRRGEGRQR